MSNLKGIMFTHKNYQIKHQDQVQMKKLLRKMNLLTSILNALFKKKNFPVIKLVYIWRL